MKPYRFGRRDMCAGRITSVPRQGAPPLTPPPPDVLTTHIDAVVHASSEEPGRGAHR